MLRREIEYVGEKEKFIEEANRRRDEKRERAQQEGKDLSKDRSPGAAQYVHVVISPESGEQITDEDFRRIVREWTHDEAGREHPHIGAVHRDSGSQGRGEGHDHMHLLIARDKFPKEELQERKELSEELVKDLERFRGLERDNGRDMGREREVQAPERGSNSGRERKADYELER